MIPTYLHMSVEQSLPKCPLVRPFAAVVILRHTLSHPNFEEISRWLVDHGCLYMMAWGIECKRFHDYVDDANIQAFPGEEVPDEAFVMTTWHDDEPLEEVLWFAEHCTHHNGEEFDHLLLLDIAEEACTEEVLGELERSRDLHLRNSE
ncbi:MAG: hypothetical protein AAF986_04530 [Pseudomonadota bacterium]